MKSNVDLTENRDFNKHSFYNSISWRERTHKKIQNIFGDLIEENFYKDSSFVLQGNKRERYYKKLTNSFGDGICCDRCGRNIYPYENDTLCMVCREMLRLDFFAGNIINNVLKTGIMS